MKFTIAIFALFTVSMGELTKMVRPAPRQAAGVDVSAAAMTNVNGEIVPFDSAGVYLASAANGL